MTGRIPELTRSRAMEVLSEYCENRIPLDARSHVRLLVTVRGSAVTILEERAPWDAAHGLDWTPHPLAQFRFDAHSRRWSLYWRDSHERWHRFEDAPSSPHLETLVGVLDHDETGVFWG